MTRRLTIAACLIVSLLSACRAVTPGSPGSATAGAASPSAPPSSVVASATASAPPRGTCELGTGVAEYVYPGLREFVSQFRGMSRGVAIAEVVSVGELRYATESGERPSCEEIEAAQAVFSIGRLVEVRVMTPVGGAISRGQVVSYLYQGGSLGRDSSPGHPFGLEVPRAGDQMLVLVAREPIDVDPGSGELSVDILEMFRIAPNGRVVTPDPGERITTDRVADLLRDVLPSASPAN